MKFSGELQRGTLESVAADGLVELGYAPSERKQDWVELLRVKD